MSELIINATNATAAFYSDITRQVEQLNLYEISNESYEQKVKESLIKNLTDKKFWEFLDLDTYPEVGDVEIIIKTENNTIQADRNNMMGEPDQFFIKIITPDGGLIVKRVICCGKYHLLNVLENCYFEGDAIFDAQPIYVHGLIKEGCSTIHTTEIEYVEPDLECEEDIPLFDCDECPVCMEKFGLNETRKLINKKIIKITKTVCVKRNTYCGHPLCIECFNGICRPGDKNICPICRADYVDTGDITTTESQEEIGFEEVEEMMEGQDERLKEIVDIEALVAQMVVSEGLSEQLGIRDYKTAEHMRYAGGYFINDETDNNGVYFAVEKCAIN